VKLEVHVFFDPQRALNERNELFLFITKLKSIVVVGGVECEKYRAKIEKYLIVRKSLRVEGGYTVNVREDVVEAELAMAGWLVLVSNYVVDVQRALDVYRMRDVVEKSFWQFKSNFGLDRLRVHSDVRAENKLFVAFVALILSSCVYNVLWEKGLCGEFTFDGVFLVLSRLKSVCIGGQHILRPLSRVQRVLFEAFGLPVPVG